MGLPALEFFLFPPAALIPKGSQRAKLIDRDIIKPDPDSTLKHEVEIGGPLKQKTSSRIAYRVLQVEDRTFIAANRLAIGIVLIRSLIAELRTLAKPVFMERPIG